MAEKNTPHLRTAALEDVLHESMIPYAEYVIMERALPRVEDGLKPVQRRILFTMLELSLLPEKPHRKSARIVGDCLGKYHPHGDTSVYDAMVRMSQPFALRAPLVDGHGNFGSLDGDPAAAMRYTEARMTPLAMEMLRDIDQDTVEWGLNFDDTQKEPKTLPGRYPNLLTNGATGIAVGLATNIPPHNLRELVAAVAYRMEHPGCTLDQVMEILPAPDFPTGGLLVQNDVLKTAYETGRGKLTLRAKAGVEYDKSGKSRIVLSELPFQANKATLLERIAKTVEEKKDLFGGVSDIRDESDREGIRAVIELRRGVDAYGVLELLYKYTDLQVSFGVNMVAIADGKPRTLSLVEMMDAYIRHQVDVVTRRTRFQLTAAQRRGHLLEGFTKVLDDLDRAIAIIRAARTVEEARTGLMAAFALDREQAQAVLDLRLQRLTGMEQLSIAEEYKKVAKRIEKLSAILKSSAKLRKVIVEEMREIADKHGDDRRTQLIPPPKELPRLEHKRIQAAQQVALLFTHGGYLLRLPVKAVQKGVEAGENGQTIAQVMLATTADKLHAFTDAGQVVQLAVSAIPECKTARDKGTLLFGLLAGLEAGERVVALHKLPPAGELLFVTCSGQLKRTEVAEYTLRKSRAAAISLKEGDALADVQVYTGTDVLLVTRGGYALRCAPEVPVTRRVTGGVRGMQLLPGDSVLDMVQLKQEGALLLVAAAGYVKRVNTTALAAQKRGGKGARMLDVGERARAGACLVAALCPRATDILAVEDAAGNSVRLPVEAIPHSRKSGNGEALPALPPGFKVESAQLLPGEAPGA